MSRLINLALAGALCWASACMGPKPASGDENEKSEAAPASESTKSEPAPAPAPAPAPTVASEDLEPPPWFDTAKIHHAAVIQQMGSQPMPNGRSWAMVLELETGVSAEQCIDRAKAAIGESVAEIPEAVAADGRLTITGKTDSYEYTVVCGEAKGKPTMYLGYISP